MHIRFSYVEAYLIFRHENPDIKISFSKFYVLRPANMKALSNTPLLSCMCIYCANVILKLVKLNIPGITTEYHLYDNLICKRDIEKQKFRNNACIFKTCRKCKDWESTIKSWIPGRLHSGEKIEWYSWKNEEYTTKANKTSKRKALMPRSGTIDECIKELIETDIIGCNQGFTWVQHYFTQKFQYKKLAECKLTLEDGEALCIQDFSNNIDLKHQDEVKGAHWGTTQVTVHPSVVYAKIPGQNELKRVVITHLSDIKQHDAHMVNYITSDCIKYLSDKFELKLKKLYLWSDGCTSQYKGKTSFYYLANYNIEIERNFFGSEHGKNESDGVTGQISKKVSDAIKSRRHSIKDANEMLNFLSNNFDKETYHFELITDKHLKPIQDAFEGIKLKVLTGSCTRSLHQIKPAKKKGFYLTCPFSCFCPSCKSDNYDIAKTKTLLKAHSKPKNCPQIYWMLVMMIMTMKMRRRKKRRDNISM